MTFSASVLAAVEAMERLNAVHDVAYDTAVPPVTYDARRIVKDYVEGRLHAVAHPSVTITEEMYYDAVSTVTGDIPGYPLIRLTWVDGQTTILCGEARLVACYEAGVRQTHVACLHVLQLEEYRAPFTPPDAAESAPPLAADSAFSALAKTVRSRGGAKP